VSAPPKPAEDTGAKQSSVPADATTPVTATTRAGAAFLKRCKALDRINSGCILRKKVELELGDKALSQLVARLEVAELSALLDEKACGKTGAFVAYRPLLKSLETLVPPDQCADDAPGVLEPPSEIAVAQVCDELAAPHQAAAEVPADSEQSSPPALPIPAFGATRSEIDVYNKALSERRKAMLKETYVTPKVSANPMLAPSTSTRPATPLAYALAEQVSYKNSRIAAAKAAAMQTDRDRAAKLLTELEAESAAQATKKADTRKMLRQSWEAQIKHKAVLSESLQEATEKWPYCPTHRCPRTPLLPV